VCQFFSRVKFPKFPEFPEFPRFPKFPEFPEFPKSSVYVIRSFLKIAKIPIFYDHLTQRMIFPGGVFPWGVWHIRSAISWKV